MICIPDVVCVQETWLKPNVRKNPQLYCGYAFIKANMPFRDVNKGKEVEEEEYIVLEIWTSQFNIINHYNSCRKQGINELKQIQGQIRNHIFR